jgi:Tfp pilus assembly protein PilO
MKLLLALASIPFYVWLLVAGAWAYMSYSGWEKDTLAPLVASIDSKKTQLKNLKANNDRAEAFKREREERFRKIQDLELQLKATSDRIPRTSNIPEILKSLANISDKVGLEFYSFKPAREVEDSFLRITPIEVQLKGSYAQVMSFLDETSHVRKIVAAKTLTLEKPTARAGTSIVSAKATIHSYRIESDAEAAARAQALQEKQAAKSPQKPAAAKSVGR